MSEDPRARVTQLLMRVGRGDRQAVDELMPLVYDELRALAGSVLRGARPGHTLQPTAVLGEAYLRLMGERANTFENRQHFLAVAARAMRSVLVDHERKRASSKRGGGHQRVELSDSVAGYEERGLDLLAVEEALAKLERVDPALVRVVDLLFFGGLSAVEAARVLGCSSRTVERDWRSAKAFLRVELEDLDGTGG